MGKSRFLIRAMLEGETGQCEKILRSLPDWFGIEQAIVDYVRDIQVMETFVTVSSSTGLAGKEDGGEIVGFLTLHQHNEFSAEIHVMGVVEEHHGLGLGRAFVEYVEQLLRLRRVEYLEVKTMAPSSPNEPYQRTRGFYRALGFRPLEENQLWGEDNPCLIMIKHLG
jgi:GNAT superfamily N-acetyltransferase